MCSEFQVEKEELNKALFLLADNEEAADSYRAKVLLAVFNLKMYNKLLEDQL